MELPSFVLGFHLVPSNFLEGRDIRFSEVSFPVVKEVECCFLTASHLRLGLTDLVEWGELEKVQPSAHLHPPAVVELNLAVVQVAVELDRELDAHPGQVTDDFLQLDLLRYSLIFPVVFSRDKKDVSQVVTPKHQELTKHSKVVDLVGSPNVGVFKQDSVHLVAQKPAEQPFV